MFNSLKQRYFKHIYALREAFTNEASKRISDTLMKDNLFYHRMLQLENYALHSTESGVASNNYFDGKKIVISLTTYSKRLYEVFLPIESIMQQTVKANNIILWLQEDWQNAILPKFLQNQIRRGLEIGFYKDIKSYKKLIPTLKRHPDDIIVTIDDDIIFAPDMLENLLLSYKKYPQYIHTNRAHFIKLSGDGTPDKYMNWYRNTNKVGPSFLVFPTGGGGTLYPPHSLSMEVFNENTFMSICPSADDIWFKAMSLLNDTQCYKIQVHAPCMFFNPNNQDIGLFHENSLNGMNDEQLQSVFSTYHLYDILKKSH
ncbi:MAG: hypothetical protein IKH26_04605 [Bacteroidaceae bacterium]|nr:hypothetical protein [Bacteroidaceae bacterium]